MERTAGIEIGDRLRAAFAGAGVDGALHAVDVDSGREVGWHAGDAVILASVVKIGLLVDLFRRADRGELDLTGRVGVGAGARSPGPTGISQFQHDVELSWRDLAQSMISVSDNAATDVITDHLGMGQVNATLRALGLERTVLRATCQEIYDSLLEDLDMSLEELGRPTTRLDPERVARCRQLAPEHGNASTPEETTRLLGLIWRDEAASADSCAAMRRILHSQVWPHRLSSAFEDGVRIGAKTGTLLTVRNEAGVVELADGSRYAVAVFTRAHDCRRRHHAADAVIGTAARLAIDSLRT